MYQARWGRKLVELRIAPDTVVVPTGQTVQFSASAVFSDGRSRRVNVAWAATGGTIDSTGLFTADSTPGTYQVIGSEPFTGLTDTAAVVDTAAVTGAPADTTSPPAENPAPVVATISISPSSSSILVGNTLQLKATPEDTAGVVVPGITFVWTSSDPSIATVSSAGVVKGIAAGSVTVTATSQGVRGAAVIGVSAPTPSPTSPGPTSCADEPHLRIVDVSTFSELNSAALNASPGDLIILADGRYDGRLSILDQPGTASAPITICGSRNAIVGASSYNSGANGLLLMRSPYWHLVGFRLSGGSGTGIAPVNSAHFEIRDVEVDHVNTGIHPYTNSHHGLIRDSYVHDTGVSYPEYGEGIYVGSYEGNWCQFSNCLPDRTDSIRILNNRLGPNIRSEALDAKEGTTGGIFDGNVIDGHGMVMSQDWNDAWVEIKGNGWRITNNRGVWSQRDGYQVENSIAGWSSGNFFAGNTADVQASGYGFMIRVNKTTNIVKCGQTVTNAGSGYANSACQP